MTGNIWFIGPLWEAIKRGNDFEFKELMVKNSQFDVMQHTIVCISQNSA